jgi:hypothetical protein
LPDDRLIGDVVFYRRAQGARGRWMGSLIEELKRREAAARAEADRPRSRVEELEQDLARAEEQASRLAIAREEVMRVLEEPPGTELPSGQPDVPAKEHGPGSPIGIVTGPAWRRAPMRRCCRSLIRTCWKSRPMPAGRCGRRRLPPRRGRAPAGRR